MKISVIMRQCWEMLVQGFALIGNTVLGTDEQIKELWNAVLPWIVGLFVSLVTVTVILGWASLMVRMMR